MLIRVAEPHPLLAESTAAAVRARGDEPVLALHEIDSSRYVHDEATLLNADELAAAKAALIEDGIFPAREWAETDLRAAIKYGWAIAHAAVCAAEHGRPARDVRPPAGPVWARDPDIGETPKATGGTPMLQGAAATVWSVAEAQVAMTPGELRFVAGELRAREIGVTHFAPCWPVSIEPAIELGERAEAFHRALADFAPALDGLKVGLFIPHAAGKAIELAPADALLDFTNTGWLEAARVLARADAPLFRRVLACAQEHFALDKPRAALATTEDDIRTLPDVPDADLEHTFLDDPRGRQLLHVTARSIFADASLREPLVAFVSSLP